MLASLELWPSLLSADFSNLSQDLAPLQRVPECTGLHLDIMDGHFVPNLSFGPLVLNSLRRVWAGRLDAHLMVTNPESYFEPLHKLSVEQITVHWEGQPHLHRLVEKIRAMGIRPGVSINPATPVESLKDIVSDLNHVLIMSVNPGFGGQNFIPGSLDKIQRLSYMRQNMSLNFTIQVDGGINTQTIGACTRAGATSFVAGNAIFSSSNREKIITELLHAARNG